MFPVLVYVYVRPTRSEEGEVAKRFGSRSPHQPTTRR